MKMEIAQSLSVEPKLYSDPRVFVRIHHPTEGWGVVDVMNRNEFRVRFEHVLAWFSLSDPIVAQWPIENAVEFARWRERVAR